MAPTVCAAPPRSSAATPTGRWPVGLAIGAFVRWTLVTDVYFDALAERGMVQGTVNA